MVLIDKKEFTVNEDEFVVLPHKEYTNLKILDKVGYYERIIGLISELTKTIKIVDRFFNINSTHGGFLDIHCANLLYEDQDFADSLPDMPFRDDVDLICPDSKTWHCFVSDQNPNFVPDECCIDSITRLRDPIHVVS